MHDNTNNTAGKEQTTDIRFATQAEAMEHALATRTEPVCIHCNRPLDFVYQPVEVTRVWRWNAAASKFDLELRHEVRPAFCGGCWDEDAGYANEWLLPDVDDNFYVR
ncbi:MAG: hypothetical protein IT379_14750 [Deltaproteobacteria bacterium]|nr:hypothetical protein [Deltaproteobacteria bacterium]